MNATLLKCVLLEEPPDVHLRCVVKGLMSMAGSQEELFSNKHREPIQLKQNYKRDTLCYISPLCLRLQ